MAIIGAIIGGGAIIGIATADEYSDYSNYSDYDNYSNYSDAAERRKRRQTQKMGEINNKRYEVNTYKSESVNEYLQSDHLIQTPGVEVSVTSVKTDGDKKLQADESRMINSESALLKKEIKQIDDLIGKIDKILEE